MMRKLWWVLLIVAGVALFIAACIVMSKSGYHFPPVVAMSDHTQAVS